MAAALALGVMPCQTLALQASQPRSKVDVYEASLADLQAALAAGRTSSVDLVDRTSRALRRTTSADRR